MYGNFSTADAYTNSYRNNYSCMKEKTRRSAEINEMYVPEKPRKRCTGFSYIGPELYNMIPKDIKEAKTTDVR